MHCSNCGKKVKPNRVCKNCGTLCPKKEKTNALGNAAIVFAFLFPILGLIFGIVAVCVGPKKLDSVLTKDGIKAIIMSFVVTGVWILFWIVVGMLGFAAPFIIIPML